MADDQHMYGRQFFEAQIARHARDAEAKKSAFDKEHALNAVRMKRFITQDEAMKSIRKQVENLHRDIMDKMGNPKKRDDDESSDILIAKFQCYQNVLNIFDGLIKYGDQKGKELKALSEKEE